MGFNKAEIDIQASINKVSLAAAAISFLTWSLIGILRPKLVNRVTLRLQAIIAFIDIFRHVSAFDTRVEDDTLCAIIGAAINLSDLIYVAFNVLLAINAHIIFISRRRPRKTLYASYTVIVLSYFMVLTLCYYTNGSYGRSFNKFCNFKARDGRIVKRFYMIYSMQFPGVIYCAYVVFLVMFKFKKRMANLKIVRAYEYERVEERNFEPSTHVKALYWRMSMYPISCFITVFPHLIGVLLSDIGLSLPAWYRFLFMVCKRLPGTTNFLFMLYDPHFQLALKEFITYVKNLFIKKPKDDGVHELEEQRQSARSSEDQTWHTQMTENHNWKIEFNDGYKMSLQDHIKYL